jgi:hypothetical protein
LSVSFANTTCAVCSFAFAQSHTALRIFFLSLLMWLI